MGKLSTKNQIVNRVISMVLGILMGVVLVVLGAVVKAETLVWLALIVWGVIIIIGNVPGLISSIANIKEKGSVFDLIISIIGILMGVALIIGKAYDILTIIVAIYMLIFPIIRVVLAKTNWGEQLKREALRIVLGVVLLVFGGVLIGVGMTVLNILLAIIGWVVIALATVFGLIDIIRLATKKNAAPAEETPVVETTAEEVNE
jgi:hypothetical protein